MEGKVALVTGSTSGIGLGVARALAKQGCSIIITGFADDSLIKELKEEFTSQYKVRCEYVSADLCSTSEIEAMCKQIYEMFPGGVDILFNNAGFNIFSEIKDFPLDGWNKLVAVMLTAPFLLTKNFIKSMMDRGWGRIINTASVVGVTPRTKIVPYSTIKAGIIGFTKGTALEGAPYGVTCNAISPSMVDTQLQRLEMDTFAKTYTGKPEGLEQAYAEFNRIPISRLIRVDEVAAAICFLCSDGAAAITGSNIPVDGGWLAKGCPNKK